MNTSHVWEDSRRAIFGRMISITRWGDRRHRQPRPRQVWKFHNLCGDVVRRLPGKVVDSVPFIDSHVVQSDGRSREF